MKKLLLFVVLLMSLAACKGKQEAQTQTVLLEISLQDSVKSDSQDVQAVLADIRKVIAKRLEVEEKDILEVEGDPTRLSVNLPMPVDTTSINRLLSQRGEFGFWETYHSNEIAGLIVEGSKQMKDGERIIRLLKLNSDDYCILGYVQEKDTAEVNRLLQNEEIQKRLSPDVRLYWGVQEEMVSRGMFSNEDTDMEDSETTFYGLFCVRGPIAAITGDKIIEAKDEEDSFNHSPIVTMKMNEEGARQFTDLTKKNIGQPIAIVIDGRVYSAPRVNMEITGGNASISGQYTPEQTKELALILGSGILKRTAKIVTK
ncbi:MAG: hypothetical protein IKX36_03575 [Prevotella sp.]|nr:hypothetical protein [Prevotella sp.]